MARLRGVLAAVACLGIVAAGCGNADDDTADPPPASTGDTSATEGTTEPAAPGDRDEFVEISGVPGVTDDEIRFAVIGTRANNPLGTCILDCYRDGIEAYFAYRNDEGGIYGRELVVSQELDDELTQNQVRALEVISGGEAFGAFVATLLATGFVDLDSAGVPTYVWNIHPTEFAGRENVFGSIAALCTTCIGRVVPFAAQTAGATRVAALGYGTTENSRTCAQSVRDSFAEYGDDVGIEFVYLNDNLEFGLPNGIAPEVTAMKEAGVDFITSCIDLNGMLTLAQELARQGMDDVVMNHPNTYNQEFVAEAGDLFEGDLVSVQFLPFEATAEGTPLATFLDWIDRTGGEVSELAMVGWLNADLAFQGLLAAGPEFDRESVVAATNQMTDYDADGLLNPIDWTRQHLPEVEGEPGTGYRLECSVLVRVVNGEFETVLPPDTPWACWDNSTDEWSDPEPTSFS